MLSNNAQVLRETAEFEAAGLFPEGAAEQVAEQVSAPERFLGVHFRTST